MSSKIITHSGRVVSVESRRVSVAIEVDEACSRCSAKGACAVGGGAECRIVKVDVPSSHTYKVGDLVEVAIRRSTGLVAVMLCYVVPLLLLVGVLAVAVAFNLGEGVAAVSSLLSLAIYYVVLALVHRHISKRIIFTIKNRE